ncbi:TonB-dependent receptor [Alteromonas sp. CI.11.F.A3]|uniref:TonB-dependent receptor n=1 Tax=Alteromonas sp. CI.11.F.A3 TaxID=3079555 RepID=UPI002941C6BE|nr:TonB-dependent receptor [Alteromonas sp. CI.11.F.A3]WOI36358.1 TonB-dependent receptor [Alteromonas sp. CI.11.F.A3]
MKNYKKTLLSTAVSSACASFIALTPMSYAQQAQSNTSEDVEVIIVSSTRSGKDLANTAVAVTALSSKALTDAGISDPTNLQDLAPNISIDRAGSNGLQITIRGVSSTDNTEKGDPSASFLQDGIYIARSQAQEIAFFDLDQIEILRGPQGTLYGRNATAGIVNVISAKPTLDEMYGSFDGAIGDFARRQATAMINLPISDTAALRAAVNWDKRDTYLNKNPDSPFELGSGKDALSARLSGFFELNDNVNVLVRGDYSRLDGTGRNTVKLSNFFDVLDPSTIPANGPVYSGNQKSSDELRTIGWVDTQQADYGGSTWGVMTELNWAINSELTMTYLGSYREFERRDKSIQTYDGGLVLPFGIIDIAGPQRFTGDYEQTSNELRFTYVNDFMNLQGGIYAFEEESYIEYLIFGEPGTDGAVFGFPQGPVISESLAIFGQGTFNLDTNLRLTLGARYTDDEKSRVGAAINHFTLDEPLDFTFDPDTNPIPDSLNNAEVEYSETTWKVGLDYDINDDFLLYGIVSTGYKAGGFNDGCIEGTPDCFNPILESALYYEPETITAYEIGLKMDLDNGLRTFINLFNYDYKNMQLSNLSDICGGTCQVTTNAGAAEINGLEVEARYYITASDKLNIALTWLDAEYTDYQVDLTTNLKGEKLNRSPEYTAIIGYQHVFDLESGAEVKFDLSTRYSDEYSILAVGTAQNFVQPSFTKTDVSVTYHSSEGDWYVQAFIKNIEDEVTIANASYSPVPGFVDGTVNITDPRTAGVRFGLEF